MRTPREREAEAGAARAAPSVQVLTFEQCCARLGISARTGRRLLAEQGRFPIPHLPLLGQGVVRPRRTYSSADVERYLDRAATERRT